MHAALLIELVNTQLHAVLGLLAKRSQWARHVLNRADKDFSFRDALLCHRRRCKQSNPENCEG